MELSYVYYKEAAKNEDPKVQHERDLIRRAQQFNDNFALKELLRLYAPLIQTVIKESGVLNATDQATATTVAEKEFRELIRHKVDPNAENKPSTFIFGNLKNELQKYRDQNSNKVSRRSQDDERIFRYDQIAQGWQRAAGQEPTPESTADFITNKLKIGGKRILPNILSHVRKTERKELSGDRTIAGDEVSGADALTFSEFFSPQEDDSADKIFNDYFIKQDIETIIAGSAEFSRGERKFIRMVTGLGEYANAQITNPNQAALQAGISYSQGITARNKLIKKLEEKKVKL